METEKELKRQDATSALPCGGWSGATPEELDRKADILRKILNAGKMRIEEEIQVVPGPTVSEFHITPVFGRRLHPRDWEGEISWHLGTVRIDARPPEFVIEVPNDKRSVVPLEALLESETFKNSPQELPLVIGCSAAQGIKVIDLADAPHILVAGATKQGAMECLHSMAASLRCKKRPDELKLVFVHRGTPARDALNVLEELCAEMEERYEKETPKLPYIVCFVDEFSDLTVRFAEDKPMARQTFRALIRLAQQGRAARIHLILATQRPSDEAITGLIKANFPTRIAFRMTTREDSDLVLDQRGAERLIGQGDLLLRQGASLERIQGASPAGRERRPA